MEACMEPQKKHPHPLWKTIFTGLSIGSIYTLPYLLYLPQSHSKGVHMAEIGGFRIRHCSDAYGEGKSFRKIIEIYSSYKVM